MLCPSGFQVMSEKLVMKRAADPLVAAVGTATSNASPLLFRDWEQLYSSCKDAVSPVDYFIAAMILNRILKHEMQSTGLCLEPYREDGKWS